MRRAAAFAGMATLGSLAATCGPTPTPRVIKEVVKETVIVKEEVEKEVIKEVTKEVVKEVVKEVEVTKIVAGTPVVVKEIVKETVVVEAKPVTGKVKLWLHAQHPVEACLDGFRARYPDVDLDKVTTGRGWYEKMTTALAAGVGGPDVWWQHTGDIRRLMKMGGLLDITEQVDAVGRDNWMAGPFSEGVDPATGKVHWIPGDWGPCIFLYRKDFFEKAGYPDGPPAGWTYDDYIEIGQKMKKDLDVNILCYPPGWRNLFQGIHWQLGGSITNRKGDVVTLDDEIGIKAMTLVKKLWDSGIGLDVGSRSPAYWAAIKAGKLVGDWSPAWFLGFYTRNITLPEEGLGQFRVGPLPVTGEPGCSTSSNLGGAGLSIAAHTKDPEAGWAFVKYSLGTIEAQIAEAKVGMFPNWLPAQDSDEYKNMRLPVLGDQEYTSMIVKGARTIPVTFYRTEVFSEAMTFMGNAMPAMERGDVTVAEGMKTVADQAREANKAYW